MKDQKTDTTTHSETHERNSWASYFVFAIELKRMKLFVCPRGQLGCLLFVPRAVCVPAVRQLVTQQVSLLSLVSNLQQGKKFQNFYVNKIVSSELFFLLAIRHRHR